MPRRKKSKSEKHHRHHQHQHQHITVNLGGHAKKSGRRKRGGGGGGGGGVRQIQGYASINLPPTYVNYNFPAESNFGRLNQSAPTPNLVPHERPVNTINPVPIMNNSELQPAGRPLTDGKGWRESRVKYFDTPKPEPEKMKLPESHPFEKPEPNILEPEGKYTPIYESLPKTFTGREFEKPTTAQFFGLEKTPEPKPLYEAPKMTGNEIRQRMQNVVQQRAPESAAAIEMKRTANKKYYEEHKQEITAKKKQVRETKKTERAQMAAEDIASKAMK